MTTRTYVIGGKRFEVVLEADGTALVNGERYTFERPASELHPAPIAAPPARAPVRAARQHATRTVAGGELRAPMAGRVIQLPAAVGDEVEAGAPLVVLDAMKMENTLFAPSAGRVEELAVGVGDTVLQGALLVRLALES